MKNSYRFFENRDCQYFPCHKGLENFNCMFCYCPFYLSEKCPGNPAFVSRGNNEIIKDCTDCNFPHRPESYDVIIRWIMHENKHRTFSEEIRKKAVLSRKADASATDTSGEDASRADTSRADTPGQEHSKGC